MIVDDDDDIVEVLTTPLRQDGIEVASARGVDEAVALVARLRPALVVLDVQLADGDGYEVAARLREDPRPRRHPARRRHRARPGRRGPGRLVLGPTTVVAKATAGPDLDLRRPGRGAPTRAAGRRHAVTRVLVIVDDDPDIREIATLSLEMTQGWKVISAASGAEALEVIARVGPDAVLLDVMMPGQDGPATLKALRAQESTSHVPVVFLTAKAQVREREQLQGLGAAGVLAKPFDPMTLGAELAAALGWD